MLLSIFLILRLGIVIQYGMRKLPLPGLLGLLFLGVALGPQGFDLLAPVVLDYSQDLRLLALIVILLRAGLGLNLNQVKTSALGLGVIPCLVEGLVVTVASRFLLEFSWPAAASLGFVLAAVSPAVVVPSMLWLKEWGLGMSKGIPVMILAGASVDDVVAITFLSSALGWAAGSAAGVHWQLLIIPARILGGIALGLAVGWVLLKLMPLVSRFNKGYGALAAFCGPDAETGFRDILWMRSQETSDEAGLRGELLALASQLSAFRYQNFELQQSNREYEMREGSLQSTITMLRQKLEREGGR